MPSEIKLTEALRMEYYYPPGKNGGRKHQYIFKCRTAEGSNEIKIKALSRLKTSTGLCVLCNNRRLHPRAMAARRLKPHEALYNRLKDSYKTRGIEVSISYEEFLSFTSTENCTYCLGPIVWDSDHRYHLDRKDNNLSYTLDNVVVCCAKCNKGKRELYSYEEWYGMTKYFRKKR